MRPTRAVALRFGAGFGFRGPALESDGKIAFGCDALVVGRIGIGRGQDVAAVWPEIGWSYVGSDGHFLSTGVGPAFQRAADRRNEPPPNSWALVPRFLYGTFRGHRASGFRVSVLGESLHWATFGFEGAYQLVHVESTLVHEVRFALISGVLFGHVAHREP